MNRVIMIPEERYSKMIDSYDQAVGDLAKVRKQLEILAAGRKVIELLQGGELVLNSVVLEDIFASYTDNRNCPEGVADMPGPIRQLMKWMDSNIESFPEEIGDSVIEALGDYEKQWFINGFRYAMGIVQAC